MGEHYKSFRSKLRTGKKLTPEDISIAIEEYAVEQEISLLQSAAYIFEKYKLDFGKAKRLLSKTLQDKLVTCGRQINLIRDGVATNDVRLFATK